MCNRYLAMISLLALTLLSGCSSIISATSDDGIQEDRGERSLGAYIDDEIIETKALVNIDKAHPDLAQSHIIVVSYNGIALLAGQVPSEELRRLAAKTVANVKKVRRVHNELTLSGNTSMLARSNDGWITTKVKSKLLASGEIEGGRVKVVTENGVVYLMGILAREEADKATEIARKTGGVQKVVRIFEYI